MPITANNPFKGRQHPGELIILCVRLYLRYPLSYEHVAELAAERGVEVDASCIWRWVQAYAPELNKRCRSHLKPANKSYRIDETYINSLSINRENDSAIKIAWAEVLEANLLFIPAGLWAVSKTARDGKRFAFLEGRRFRCRSCRVPDHAD